MTMTAVDAPTHNPTRAAIASGALFVDDQDRIMLVKPTYKSFWDIPGGYVEPGESPAEGCAREVREELGIEPHIGKLLVTDWAPTSKDGDKVLFVFDGGRSPQSSIPRSTSRHPSWCATNTSQPMICRSSRLIASFSA
jgi:ADP-ribose pyrophosphatase YjhB (NUDIX family)